MKKINENNIDEYICNAYTLINDFKNYFASDKIQNIINNVCISKEKIYLKAHILKSLNLYTSFLILNLNNTGIRFIDESKILLRSLCEHILNCIYIFIMEDEIDREKKINRFFDYEKEILPSQYYIEQIKDIEEIKKKNESQEKLLDELLKIKESTKFSEKIENFKNKYNNNTTTWHGLKGSKFLRTIEDNWIFGTNLRETFKYILKKCNGYVHCNKILYLDNTGAIVENNNSDDYCLTFKIASKLMFGYLEIIMHILDITTINNPEYDILHKKSKELLIDSL